ncbi:aminopeptidase N [Alginatibacterium sediminis]|uniref:Aminopeptidase N n=1 Tax=Alginatibacterium sediminis TaxID=2164068 RepID=A0A420EHM2_9ALTE|nr:aminopeptidase N [Alginatibacterium sediminis]RKF20205.1 aminopeptidase N [Alginatibacterium sediminis]
MSALAKFRLDYQAPSHTIKTIELDISLNETATKVVATTQISRLDDSSKSLVLSGEQMTLLSVLIDGRVHTDYVCDETSLTLTNIPADFELEVSTQIDPLNNKTLEGLYVSDGAYCTQCEAEGFRRITYYLDRPDVLAVFTTTVRADKSQFPYLLSNGNKVASGDLGDGQHWAKWHDPFPKPSYLFALVAGDFDVREDSFTTRSGREVALQIFVDKGNFDRSEHAMTSLIESMRWDEERFGLEYDLDIYMIVAVDFFNMGAMENKGLNVFNSKYVLANKNTAVDEDFLGIEAVIGHEYFHNWTGNRITCRDWFQLSLKEGLTVFRDQEFSSDLGSRSVNRIKNVRTLRGHQFAEDAGPMAHPIRPEKVIEMNNFYTLTVYEKGSEVIRMLHTLLGEQAFQAGMKLYVERFDGQAVTCDDFVQAMQDASGVDLVLFKRWYSQSGTPEVSVQESYDASLGQYQLTLSQLTPVTADQDTKQPLYIPVGFELLDSAGKTIVAKIDGKALSRPVLDFTQAQQAWTFTGLNEKPCAVLFTEFSAPVKVKRNLSSDALQLILENASNEFSRWDAAAQMFNLACVSMVADIQQGKRAQVPDSLLNGLLKVLENHDLNPEFVALVLSVPSEQEFYELFELVDVEAVASVRDQLLSTIATQLQPQLKQRALQMQSQDQGTLSHADIACRALVARCQVYLAHVDPSWVIQCYNDASSMNDKIAAMESLVAAQAPGVEKILSDFENSWCNEPLVMDKWLSMQARVSTTGAIARVDKLREHPIFSLENPNRVRSVIGAFIMGNQRNFHAKDGSGYAYLCQVLIDLNSRNPQLAARLITPMIQVKHFDDNRKALIKSQLQRLAALPDLSKDLFEKVSNGLEQLIK